MGTSSSNSTNSQSHILACNREVNRISNSISDDVLAFGLKNAAQTAFNNFSEPILTRGICPSPSTRSGQSTQSNPLRTGLPFRRTIRQDDKVVETFFGMSSRTSLLFSNQSEGPPWSEEEDRFGHETFFSFIPARRLVQLGFTYGLSSRTSQSPLSGLTVALDVIRSVPDDAVAFDLCEEGNLSGVQALLNGGQASAKDVDSMGRTPLYISSIDCFLFPCHSLPSGLEKQLCGCLDHSFHILTRYTSLLQSHATWNFVDFLFVMELTETHESMMMPMFLTTMCGK